MGKQQSKLKKKQVDELKKESKFTADELQDLFKVFNRFCTKGGIALKSFQEMYKMFFPGGDADSFAEHVYKSMDKNLDGTVDFREFAQMLSVSKKGTQDEKIKMAFHMYDIDKNGEITRSEMLQTVEAIYLMMGCRVEFPDDEATPEMRVEKIFKNLDKDRNGTLSLEEFIEGAKSDKRLWVH